MLKQNKRTPLWACCLIGALATFAAEAAVVINEIHFDPDVKTDAGEFLELHNAGDVDLDLTGWRVSGGISHRFADGTLLFARGYLVLRQAQLVSASPPPPPTGGRNRTVPPMEQASLIFEGRLSNEGERIVLSRRDGSIADAVTYRLGFPWPTVGDPAGNGQSGTGRSIQLVNPTFDNDLAGNWRSA